MSGIEEFIEKWLPQYQEATIETFQMVGISLFYSILIGIPIRDSIGSLSTRTIIGKSMVEPNFKFSRECCEICPVHHSIVFHLAIHEISRRYDDRCKRGYRPTCSLYSPVHSPSIGISFIGSRQRHNRSLYIYGD